MPTSQELIAALSGRTPNVAEATAIEDARFAEAKARGEAPLSFEDLSGGKPIVPISTNQPEINKSLAGTMTGTTPTVPGLTAETPETREAITAREQRKRDLLAAGVEEKFAEEFSRVEEERKGRLGQQGAVAGAQAQGLGFSSAEIGVISMINRRFDERKSDLEKQKSEALRNLDIDTADRVDKELKTQQDRFDSQMDRVFDQFIRSRADVRSEAEFKQKGTEFNQKQEDRVIESAVGTFVTIDENGDITRPDDQSLKQYAEAKGIDPLRFATGINKKIDELEKLGREQRKAEIDRLKSLADIEATEALAASRRADVAETELKLPLEVQELQSKIRENNAQTQKALSGVNTDTGFSVNDMLDGYANVFGEHYGSDGKLDTDIYLQARNEFVQQFKSNKEFYDKLFLRNYPPSILLNNRTDEFKDERALSLIAEEKKLGSQPIINFSLGSNE